MTTIALIFGGRSVEHKVSITSARTVADGLRQAGYDIAPVGIAQDGCFVAAAEAQAALDGDSDLLPPRGLAITETFRHLLAARADAVFPIVHGTWGEDGCLQGLCEMLDLPYVGTGVLASAVAMDKLMTKRLLAARGLPVVDGEEVTRAQVEADSRRVLQRLERLTLPIFVKPSVGGSSVGVVRVNHRQDIFEALRRALQFDDRLVVEKGVAGRELECAVLGWHQIEASVIGEIVPGNAFYDYADKYLEDGARLIAPAELAEPVADQLRQQAIDAFATIGGAGMARIDFLFENEDSFYINEINTLPGFTAISMYPRLWQLSGVPLPSLVDRLVTIARERHRQRRNLDQGIKHWIGALEERLGKASTDA